MILYYYYSFGKVQIKLKKIKKRTALLLTVILLTQAIPCHAAETSDVLTRENIATEYADDEQFQMMLEDFGIEYAEAFLDNAFERRYQDAYFGIHMVSLSEAYKSIHDTAGRYLIY